MTAPRYQLPPDQVLSTFPPAGTQGSYGSRLPQIVIKRRTLPWERGLTLPDGHGGQVAVDEKTPWLALVLIAEGEAELRLNQDVAQCVTKGVTLEGAPDVAKGNCLVVRQSVVEKILPSRKDVPMLAHAREVDIHDTELMMGDDDGFLAVVISNRLPVPGLDANGREVPVKYLACLINLEGQFEHLIPEAPPHRDTIQFHGVLQDAYVSPAVYDHVVGGGLVEHWGDLAVNPSEVLGAQSVGMLAAPEGGPLDDAAPALDGAAPAGGPAALAGASAADTLVVKSLGATTSAYVASAGYAATKQERRLRRDGQGLRALDLPARRARVHVPGAVALELHFDREPDVREPDARARLGAPVQRAGQPTPAAGHPTQPPARDRGDRPRRTHHPHAPW